MPELSVSPATANALTLQKELDWFENLLRLKLEAYYAGKPFSVLTLPPPDLTGEESVYASIANHYEFTLAERLTVLLAALPLIAPQLLNPLMKRGQDGKVPVVFGGVTGQTHPGFIPTGQTALFLLAGDNLDERLEIMYLFSKEHYFYQYNILGLKVLSEDEPLTSGILQLSEEYLETMIMGGEYIPAFSEKFPARPVRTPLEWDDLILPAMTREKVDDIRAWIRHRRTLVKDWGLEKRIKPGFRSLFYGPPGTGKTLTAGLLGKVSGMTVFRVDLALTVSKWVGETEKNLMNLFDQAMYKNWILFFDEADVLFAQRSKTQHNAHDQSINQHVAYLLQRIEDFPGVVILASNLRGNIDEAFTRRLQSIVYFPPPGPEERLRLWQDQFLDQHYRLAENIDLQTIARQYEITGGGIINVLRYVCVKAAERGSAVILKNDLLEGIRQEFEKEGKTLISNER